MPLRQSMRLGAYLFKQKIKRVYIKQDDSRRQFKTPKQKPDVGTPATKY